MDVHIIVTQTHFKIYGSYVYIYICVEREREITNMSNIMCGPYTRVDACCLLLMMWTAVKEPGRCRDAPNNLIVFQGLAQLRRWAVEPKTYHKDGASTAEHSECHQQKLKNSSAQKGKSFCSNSQRYRAIL